jgi:hypothetical protein
MSKNQHIESTRQLLSVPREPSSKQATITPPDIKMKQELRVLHVVAWHSVAPPVPTSAVSRNQLITPAIFVASVAPPQMPISRGRRTYHVSTPQTNLAVVLLPSLFLAAQRHGRTGLSSVPRLWHCLWVRREQDVANQAAGLVYVRDEPALITT